jgi:nitroreductase/NAD-dependent dihydropyrimidine dehydrogenase PreA subunit
MLENSKVFIDIDSCTKCKACVNECRLYYFDSDTLCLEKIMDEECIECGKCVAICPVNAIRLKVHTNEILKDVPIKQDLPSFESLVNLFQIRRSRRQFKDIPVPKELIEKILNLAARYSPTGHNQENVYYTIIQDRDILTKLSMECTNEVKNIVEKFNDPQGKESLKSVLPVEVMKKIEEVIPSFKQALILTEKGNEIWRWNAELIIIHSPKDSLTLIENCSLAACHIMLAAETLGLGTCSLGYITSFFNNFRSISKIAKIPIKHSVGYSLAIGCPKAHYHRIPARKPLKAKWL